MHSLAHSIDSNTETDSPVTNLKVAWCEWFKIRIFRTHRDLDFSPAVHMNWVFTNMSHVCKPPSNILCFEKFTQWKVRVVSAFVKVKGYEGLSLTAFFFSHQEGGDKAGGGSYKHVEFGMQYGCLTRPLSLTLNSVFFSGLAGKASSIALLKAG